MSHLANRPDAQTTTETAALTNLTALATSSANQFLRKTGTTTFENAIPANTGGGTWGSITGTLSNQIDLQTALNLKVTGATSATDNAIARFDGTTGTLIQNSFITVDDSNNIQAIGDGVSLQFYASNATSSGNTGGTVYFYAGNGLGSGNGSNAGFLGGTGGVTGAGGPVEFFGGDSGQQGSGNAGDIGLYGGFAGGNGTNSGNGGNIILAPGNIVNGGGGTRGLIKLYKDRSNTKGAFLDLTTIASTDKTFTFPNNTGTFVINKVSAQSGGASLTSADFFTTFTNEGASALATFNLPAAISGLTYTFAVQDADGIKVLANGSNVIYIGSSVSGAGGFAQSTTIGSALTIVAINTTTWVATSDTGTWSLT